MSTKITEKDILSIIGGEQGAIDLYAEAIDDKIADDGILVYVPPESNIEPVDYEKVSQIAEESVIEQLRMAFPEMRQQIRAMIMSIFDHMKDHNSDSEIKLNQDFVINISEENIDEIMLAILDGVDE